MAIVINLDVMLAKRKMRSNQLAELIGITEQNLSILKNGKARALRLTTLDAICKHLGCQPADILEYVLEE
ncbi:MAG: helix-turn-helix domain-containing protein [Gammaproteobacteria bacterium]